MHSQRGLWRACTLLSEPTSEALMGKLCHGPTQAEMTSVQAWIQQRDVQVPMYISAVVVHRDVGEVICLGSLPFFCIPYPGKTQISEQLRTSVFQTLPQVSRQDAQDETVSDALSGIYHGQALSHTVDNLADFLRSTAHSAMQARGRGLGCELDI